MLRAMKATVAGLAIVLAAPLLAQDAAQQALLEVAGQLFEMGDRAGHSGDHLVEITNYRAALDLVDEAAAMGDEPIPMIVNGRREMMLSLGEAHAKARQHDEALQVYSTLSTEIAGPDHQIPDGRTERLHYARALRGVVHAGVNARSFATARGALPRLIATGRAMYEDEPDNSYLVRRLAQDMQAEVIFRWVLEDEEGSAALARETLALFRSLAESNPNSTEALQSRFLWAYGAAELNEDDIELWREAVSAGEQLQGRSQMKAEHAPLLRAARGRLEQLQRRGN